MKPREKSRPNFRGRREMIKNQKVNGNERPHFPNASTLKGKALTNDALWSTCWQAENLDCKTSSATYLTK